MSDSTPVPANRQGETGFSLVELVAAMVMTVFLVLSVQSTILSSIQSRKSAEQTILRNDLAWTFLQRLRSIPFGSGSEGDPSSNDLQELFDADDVLGPITFRQVAVSDPGNGHSFTTVNDGIETRWRISVTSDFDNDGAMTGFREGRPDLFSIEIDAEGRQIFRTFRAADFANTTRD